MGQSGNAMGWARAICYSKFNGMVDVDNWFVLDVPNLGAIIDVMLAIPVGLGDWVGVAFARRWYDLNFDPDAKDAFQLPRIDKQIP